MRKGPEGLIGKLETVYLDLREYRDKFDTEDPANQGAWRRLDDAMSDVDSAIERLEDFNQEEGVAWA